MLSAINSGHYRVLIRLFRTLGERRELTGQLGMNQRAMNLTTMGLLLPGALIGLVALGAPSLRLHALTVLAVTSMLLFMMVVIEAANTFLNPAEVTVLAHQPVAGLTYFAAKFTYLSMVVWRIAMPLNVFAAFTALVKPETRWFYPAAHLFAAYAAGIFVALLTCAVIGLLFRLFPPSRLRNAAMWFQLLIGLLPLAPYLFGRVRPLVRPLAPDMTALDLSWFPPVWFARIALIGHADVPRLGWPAVAGFALSTVFIGVGVRALSAGYLTRIAGVLRSTGGRRRLIRRPRVIGPAVRWLTGRPSGQAAVGFLSSMMWRDWQFRRGMLQIVPLFIVLIGVIFRGREVPPFGGTSSPAGVLPELIPLITLTACLALPFSDHHRGAWIFLTSPFASLRAFVRGVYWSLWLPFIALPFAALVPLLAWYWGLADAVLFGAYSLAVGSWLLGLQLLLLQGLPFSNPPKPERVSVVPFIVFGPIAVGLGFVLQWLFVFRSRPITAVATLVLILAAVVTTRLTLARVEVNVRHNLDRLSAGPTGMFISTDA